MVETVAWVVLLICLGIVSVIAVLFAVFLWAGDKEKNT